MRFGPGSLAPFLAVAAVLFLGAGCTEDKPSEADATPPLVEILAPLSLDRDGAEVRDSTDVVVRATDNDGVASVEIVFHALGADTVRTIAELTAPDTTGYYTARWKAAGIPNGSECVLRALARDRAGNVGVSADSRVMVIIESDIREPRAAMVISPSEGTILTEFLFDASPTQDDLTEDPQELLVQWDFEGDGIWNITLDDGYDIADEVPHRYPVPGTYTVTLEVYNQYYSIPLDIPGVATRRLQVKPAYGDPRPPAGEEFVQVPAGIYPLGVVSCTPSDTCDVFDLDETTNRLLRVRLSNTVYIDKYEVTNGLYIGFLNAAGDSGLIAYDATAREVRDIARDRLLLRAPDDRTRVKFQLADSSFWVDETYADHPVTGVTWDGADAYAAFYGLRLPTEAEWEAAARAGRISSTYTYPWASSANVDSTFANFFNSDDPFEQEAMIRTTPVGAFDGNPLGGIVTQDAVGPFGTYDQAGNVAEWCADWYDATTYEILSRATVMPIDPQGPDTGVDRVLRGGSWAQFTQDLRVTGRQGADPRTTAAWVGFRTSYIRY